MSTPTYTTIGNTGANGPQGPQGERGPQGSTGDRGATGPPGPRGNAGSLTIGTTTSLAPTGNVVADATVTNSGTNAAAILNFGIPQGVTGPQGNPGTISANYSNGITPTFTLDETNGDTFIAGRLDIAGGSASTADSQFRRNLNVVGDLSVTGTLTLSNDTQVGSVTQGAVVITGGLAVGKNIISGGNITNSGNILPAVTNNHNIGSSSLQWSSLFLNSVLDFNNGNVKLTHSSDTLTMQASTGTDSTTLTVSGSGSNATSVTPVSISSGGPITVPSNSKISFNSSTDTQEAIYGDGSNLYLVSGNQSYKIPTSVTNNTFLKTNASGVLSWEAPSGGNASSASTATTASNIAGGTTDDIIKQSSSGSTTFISKGSNSTVLQVSSGGTLQYGTVTNAMLDGTIADTKLSTITTSDKVSGSAIQLQTNKGISDNSGLGVTVDDSSIEIHSDGNLRVKASGITNGMLAGSIDLTSKVSGILPVANGGTGATSISVSNVLATDTGNYIVNGTGLTITLPTPLSTGNFLIIYNTSESYTLNNGNAQTATVLANKSTICIATGTSAGNWTAFASGGLLTFS